MRSKDYVDEQTTRYCEALSQRLSRRGLLGSVGRLALKVAGISVLPILPVDRAFAQFTCGGDWQLCGMHGYFCKACCGHGAQYASCPSCTTQGQYWTGCCAPDDCTQPVTIRYFDCCAPAGVGVDCTGSSCGLLGSCPTSWPAYCTSGLSFRCTIVVNTGVACGPRQLPC